MNVNYGSVKFKGRTYRLVTQAEPTNRCFHGSFHNVTRGEWYIDQWGAYAEADGIRYIVNWEWNMQFGSEPDDADALPLLDENIVSVEVV